MSVFILIACCIALVLLYCLGYVLSVLLDIRTNLYHINDTLRSINTNQKWF